MLLAYGVVLGAALRTSAGWLAALSPLSLVLPAALLARQLGWPWTVAFGVPFIAPVFVYALLNSTAKTLWRGGVCWRDTFYPLKTLRAGNVR